MLNAAELSTPHIHPPLSRPPPPSLRDGDGWSPLTMACIHGHVEAVRQLTAAGADVDAPTYYGTTPLTFAGEPDVWARGFCRQTLWHTLISYNVFATFMMATRPRRTSRASHLLQLTLTAVRRTLFSVPFSPHPSPSFSLPPDSSLHSDYSPICLTHFPPAVRHCHEEMVEVLVAAGADLRAVDHNRRTLLMRAAKSGSIPILKLLLAKGTMGCEVPSDVCPFPLNHPSIAQ